MDPWPYRPNKIEHVKSGVKKTDRVNQGGADPYGGRGEASQAEATSATLFAAHFNECIG